MAKILSLPTPPNGNKCGHYRDWLLEAFHYRLCSYCLIQHEALDIEHYEPKSYKQNLRHSPANLLIACRDCNLNKSDYHPQYTSRRTHKTQSHLILDLRTDDFGSLMYIDSDGKLWPRQTTHAARTFWNIEHLFDLNRPFLVEKRRELIKTMEYIDKISHCLEVSDSDGERSLATEYVDKFVPAIINNDLFYYCFDIPKPVFFEKVIQPLYQNKKSTVLP